MLSSTHDQAPLLWLRLLSTPCLHPICVQAIRLLDSTSLQSSISDSAMFQNPYFIDPCGWTTANSLGEDSAEQCPGAGLPQKTFVQSHSGRGLEIMTNHNAEPPPGFNTLWCLCLNNSKCGCSWGSAGTFAWGEAIWPLPNVLQVGEPLLPVWHTDPSDPAACSCGFALFPHQSTASHGAPEFLSLLHCL